MNELHQRAATLIAAFFSIALVVVCISKANAQSPVLTQPYGVQTTVAGSLTITTTNTFQTLWTLSTNTRGRAGCTIQNNASNPMFVFFGTAASALTLKSVRLTGGQSLNCIVGGVVLQDTVSITGTSGDGFYAAQQ